MGIVSLVVNLLFGTGLIVTLMTLRSQKAKARGEAEQALAGARGSELENTDKMLEMWRETAEFLKRQLDEQKAKSDEMSKQLNLLQKEISKLSRINNRIVELLDNMDHDNFEEMVQKIKEKIQNDSL